MRLSVGRIAAGPNHWIRPKIIRELLRKLDRSDVSFLGPRRTGKTSILWHLRDQYSSEDHRFVYLNVEKFSTEEQWLLGMIQELERLDSKAPWKQKLSDFSSGAVDRLKLLREIKVAGTGFSVSEGKGKTWQEVGDSLFRTLADSGVRITFLIDEFPVLVNRIAGRSAADAADLLHWFRANRQGAEGLSFLVTGSIGLRTVARRFNLGKQINDFETCRIPPLEIDEAKELAGRLAVDNDLPVDSDTIEWMLDRVGATWPYFIQLFLAAIEDLGLPGDTKLGVERLESLYKERLLDQTYNQYLENMWERLEDYFDGRQLRSARALLLFVAAEPAVVSADSLREVYRRGLAAGEEFEEKDFTYLLDVLHHDGYLLPSGDGKEWDFSSRLLRDFWQRKTR